MESEWVLLTLAVSIAALVALRSYATRRRRRARAEYQRLLQQALDDGVLSPDEIEELESVRRQGALTPEEVRTAALAIYRSALRDAAADARLTSDEAATLERLQTQLGLSEHDLGADFNRLSRLRLLARIAEGNMPDVQSPVQLVPEERCHWVVQCTLADRMSMPQGTRQELKALTFQVPGTEPFAAAGERSALRPAEDVLPSDLGALIITSRRTIFQGAKRTISVPHARTEAVSLYDDGIRIEEIGQSARRYFLVDDAELACSILLHAARQRRSEIRPAKATTRTA
jgi:uncharacterized protein YjiS (DUF1127 family)